MTVVFSKPFNAVQSTGCRHIAPPISIERPEKKELCKGKYQTYTLRNTPSDKSSPTYDLSVPFFRSGSAEEWLIFRRNLDKVVQGQNIKSGPAAFAVARKLLEGEALAVFEIEAIALCPLK